MTVGRLVLDGGDADAVAAPAVRRALMRSALRALSAAGRSVTAHGPHDEAAVDPGRTITTHGPGDEVSADPAPCRCCSTVRFWGGGQPGRRLLAARDPHLPAVPLLPAGLAAQIAAAVTTGAALPQQVRVGLPLGVWWRVFSPGPAGAEPPRHAAVDENDIAAAVLALGDGEHLELAGPGPSSVAVLADGSGWVLEQLRPRGHVVGEIEVADPGVLPAELARAADWVAAGGGR